VTHVQLNLPIALKVLLAVFAQNQELVTRFQREARSAARLDHPNIVRIYDMGKADGFYYIAMEYLERGSLEQEIVRLRKSGEVTPPARAIDVIRQVAQGLEYAHSNGIIHRDVKPSNILLRDNGQPVLTDLGIALVMKATRLTRTAISIGTPEYMSPEQVGGRRIDHRSDIYSLGVVLYELLAGQRPFQGETPWALIHQHVYEPAPLLEQVNPRLPRSVCEVVHKSLAKKPAARYQTAGEMAEALRRARAGLRGASSPLSPGQRASAKGAPAKVGLGLGSALRRKGTAFVAGNTRRARSRSTAWGNLLGLVVILAAVLVMGVAAVFLPRYVGLLSRANATPTPASLGMPNSTPATSGPLSTAPVLQGPDNGAGFHREEEIPLSWSWPVTAAVRHQLSITLTNDRDEVVLTLIAEPGSGAVYTHTLRPQDEGLGDGAYRWTVAAQQGAEGAWKTVARAQEWRSFRLGSDPRDDLTLYSSITPVGSPTTGLDILAASVAPDRRITLQPTESVPQELADWVEDGEALLWIELYDPIPENIPLTRWLLALDLDGDSNTGRPAGDHRISSDLGIEVVIGVGCNRDEPDFEPYFGIWDLNLGDFVYQSGVARYALNEGRTLVGLAVPLDALRQAAQTAGAAWNPEATSGRAAAVFYDEPENIIDLHPNP
jgi:serine/threonine-protein kinase